MHYKKSLLYIIFFSIVFMQSQFNASSPQTIEMGDARSMGIGNMHLALGTNSTLTSINPARLAYISNNNKGNISFDFQLYSTGYQERRSQVIMDDWEEHLNYSDYVLNNHNNFYNAFGIIYSNGIFGFGLSKKPSHNMNYKYEEEVRSERDCPDGYNCMKDPIMGYQVFESKGLFNLESFGFGVAMKIPVLSNINKFSIGISHNKINPNLLVIEQYIDTLYHTFDPYYDDNFDNFDQYKEVEDLSEISYNSISMEIPIKKNILFVMAYEEESRYFNSKKSIGMNIMSRKDMLMSLECNSQNDLDEFKIGFEYAKKDNIPIRMGFNWEENLNPLLAPISTLTLGTGKRIKNLDINLGLNYKMMQNKNILNPFSYLDLFSYLENPGGVSSEDYSNYFDDQVTENNLTILISMKWSL